MASKPSIFFIAGAPKTATSALWEYLTLHPEIFRPRIKEFHHFCDDFFESHMSDDDYLKAFSGMTEAHRMSVDGSVLYMYSDVALKRIHAFDPDAKIIVMLRHPVDLIYSWHSQLCWNLNEDEPSFERAWALCEERAYGRSLPADCEEPFVVQYGEIGLLAKSLKRIQSIFSDHQVKVVFMEDMKADTAGVYQEVLAFLDACPFELPEYRTVNANTELRSRFLMRLGKMQLGGASKKFLRWLKGLLGFQSTSFRRILINASTVETERKPIDSVFAAELLEYFRDDITELSQLTGRNLDHWLRKVW